MNFFYFLNTNKSRFQKLNRTLNVGNDASFDVKVAVEKLRERNLNVFSKLYFNAKDNVVELPKLKNQNDLVKYNFFQDNSNLDNKTYRKIYYKNISRIHSYGKSKYSYFSNFNTNSYGIGDLKLLGSFSFLNYSQTLTFDDSYENFAISYGGYVSSLITKSFILNSFFNIRKRNIFIDYTKKVYHLLSSNSIFFKNNFLFSYLIHKNLLFDELSIKNNSLVQKFQDLNNIYDFLYSQRKNNKTLLKKKSIYSNYSMYKKFVSSQSFNKNNFRLFNKFFYSLSRSNLVNHFESFFLTASFFNISSTIKKPQSEFFLIENILNYMLSSFLLSNNNVFKTGLVSKLLFFILFKIIYNFKILLSNFNLKTRGDFIFNKFYLLSLIIFNNRIYFDGLKNNHNVLLLNNYLTSNTIF